MKNLFLVFLSFMSLNLTAQVYITDNIHNGTNKRSYTFLSTFNSKDLSSNLVSYLKPYGKISNPEKNSYRIKDLKGNTISTDLKYIDVVHKSSKSVEKLEFFFLNDADNALNDNELNAGEAEKFVQSFIDFNKQQVDITLLNESLKDAEDELKSVEKDLKKIEKSIESNLKEQEKLGKKLDSSPELMAQAMAEKEELEDKLSTSDSLALVDAKAKASLSKASDKKDREISKIKKEAEKAESKLEKKENELESLKNDLKSAKALVRANKAVVAGAKLLANRFK